MSRCKRRGVLLYPEEMVQLNVSAAEILRRCNGQLSVDDIVAELETLFTAPDLRALGSTKPGSSGSRMTGWTTFSFHFRIQRAKSTIF